MVKENVADAACVVDEDIGSERRSPEARPRQ